MADAPYSLDKSLDNTFSDILRRNPGIGPDMARFKELMMGGAGSQSEAKSFDTSSPKEISEPLSNNTSTPWDRLDRSSPISNIPIQSPYHNEGQLPPTAGTSLQIGPMSVFGASTPQGMGFVRNVVGANFVLAQKCSPNAVCVGGEVTAGIPVNYNVLGMPTALEGPIVTGGVGLQKGFNRGEPSHRSGLPYHVGITFKHETRNGRDQNSILGGFSIGF